jgi:hypothetical protein
MVSVSCSNLRATLYTYGSHNHSNSGVVKLADDYIRNFTSYYKEHKDPKFILHDKCIFISSKQLSNLLNRNRFSAGSAKITIKEIIESSRFGMKRSYIIVIRLTC